ncbi:MAG TPA: PIG-L family deacetylase [Rubrivivax sp.]|nr:PIG-L family deacetylase [Rubrivivax sp.]
MPTAIYLSAHLDDAALSCGGLIHQQTRRGSVVAVVTLCAGDPPSASFSPFAEALHARWQLSPSEAVARRREEDHAALRGLGAGAAHGGVGFLLPEHEVQRGQHHRQHRHGCHQHPRTRLTIGQVQQGGHHGAGRIGDAHPAEDVEQVRRAQPLVALDARQGGHQQGVQQEVGQRKAHRGQHQHAGVGGRGTLQQVGQHPARGEHRKAGHGRAGDAAAPALGGAQGADAGFPGSGQSGRLRPMHQQQQEHEDLAGGKRDLGARDAHREEARQHGQHRPGGHLAPDQPGLGGQQHQRTGQRGSPAQDDRPPVPAGRTVVVGQQATLQRAPAGPGRNGTGLGCHGGALQRPWVLIQTAIGP